VKLRPTLEGHLSCKNVVCDFANDLYCVHWDVKPYYTHDLTLVELGGVGMTFPQGMHKCVVYECFFTLQCSDVTSMVCMLTKL